MILEVILVRFSIPFRPFGLHFGILFRCRIFHDFWIPFWTIFGLKSIIRLAIRNVTFFEKKSCFFWASIWVSIFDGFWWFREPFWMIFNGFLMDFRIYEVPVFNNIRPCWHPFQHRSNTSENIDTTWNISEIPSINFCIISTGPKNLAALTK